MRYDEDNLATRLLDMAYVARTMAPSWKAGVRQAITGVDGTPLGHVYPGKGIYIDTDLASLGINRPIPGVFERPPPRLDWYTRMLGRLPLNTFTAVKFCQAHLEAVVQRSVYDQWDAPDNWAPWRASPPVFTHPPKLVARPKLITPGGD